MARSFLAVTAGSGTKLGTNNYTDGADSKHDELMVLGEQFLPAYTVATGAGISTATVDSHILQIMAGASLQVRIRRIEIYQVAMANAVANPLILVRRLSTAGTGGTVFTPQALDATDAGSGATAMTLPTVKGTETGTITGGSIYMMQTLAVSNLMVGPQLVFDFDRPRSKPLIIGAGTTKGIALRIMTGVAGGSINVNVWLDESPY